MATLINSEAFFKLLELFGTQAGNSSLKATRKQDKSINGKK